MRCKTHFRSAALAFASLYCVASASFAACTNEPDATSKAATFLSNPSSLFNGPNGPRTSDEIIADVGNFVAANPQALPAVIALLKGASVDQQRAIGTGLGNARETCVRPDLNFALEIQTQLANTDSTEAQTKFAALTGVPIRSVAAGGVGGGVGVGVSGGAVGGQTSPLAAPGSNSNFQTFTSNSVSNNPTSYFSGGASGAGSAGNTTTTTTNNTTIVCTVSSSC